MSNQPNLRVLSTGESVEREFTVLGLPGKFSYEEIIAPRDAQGNIVNPTTNETAEVPEKTDTEQPATEPTEPKQEEQATEQTPASTESTDTTDAPTVDVVDNGADSTVEPDNTEVTPA